MKKYSKPQMMAKNAPTGSYAAGCPTYSTDKTRTNCGGPKDKYCAQCQTAK